MSAPKDSLQGSRHRNDANENIDYHNLTHFDEKAEKLSTYLLDGRLVWGVLFAFVAVVLTFIQYRLNRFPPAQTLLPGSPVHAFYEGNARTHLEHLALHGPRVVGSDANEVHAYNYILQELHVIKENAHPDQGIYLDEQVVSGKFDLAFINDFVSVYRNIKNIIAKIEPKDGSKHGVLMSCHFDSAVDSPGAGDNAISCAVMLEMLRALSQSETPLDHAIVFLFNGAEENILQASHGFITQHPLAKSVKAFVNIDSAGAGGWETVFQTGPAHPWLVRAYAQASPYPCGSILGQELFQSGIIPSDTDYRIFRDFGEIPGLDMAYISNGYVYHTPNDQNRFIEPGCIQRGGENLLALLHKLATSPELVDPGLDKHGVMIFFDVVGLVMVFYPMKVAMVINCALIAAVFYRVIRKVMGTNSAGATGMPYFHQLCVALAFLLSTFLVIVLTCVAMAILVTVLGRNMSWFTYNYNIAPLYIFPPVLAMIGFHLFLKKHRYQTKDPWQIEMLYFDATLVFWAVVTLLGTYYGVGSAFFPMLYVLGPLIIRDRTMQVARNWHWKSKPFQFLALHITSVTFPCLMTLYFSYAIFRLFLPIMGRSGSEVNSDIIVGVLTAAFLLMVSSYMVGLLYLSKNLDKVMKILSVVIAVWVLGILITPLGFPFSGNHESPSPQRVIAVHTDRINHDRSGTVTYQDSGIWMLSFDMTKQSVLRNEIPIVKSAPAPKCLDAPYCGLPYLIPVIKMLDPRSSIYVPAGKTGLPRVRCELKDKLETPDYTKLSFEVQTTGADHISMYVRPRANVTLFSWTLSMGLPDPAEMPDDIPETVYFVYYSHASQPDTSWTFSMYFQVGGEHSIDMGLVGLGFAGHHLHGKYKTTNELQALKNQLPDWTAPVVWSASYDSYEY